MTSEKPRRRWFRPRFSLATLFVVVTVFGVWLGWELDFIHRREAMRRQLNESLGFAVSVAEYQLMAPNEPLGGPDDPSFQIPIWRRWMGDEPMAAVVCAKEEKAKVLAFFPEALVAEY